MLDLPNSQQGYSGSVLSCRPSTSRQTTFHSISDRRASVALCAKLSGKTEDSEEGNLHISNIRAAKFVIFLK